MTRFAPKPKEFAWLAPYLTVVGSVEEAKSFYETAFGFTYAPPADPAMAGHMEFAHEGQVICMAAPEGAFGMDMKAPGRTGADFATVFCVYVDDVDAHFARAKATPGANILSEPEDMFWGDRAYRVRDPSGYAWMFMSKLADGGAAV